MNLGERIRRWREAKDLTQRDLAEAADITTAAVCLWETAGERQTSPHVEHLHQVVEALGITMSEFYGRVPRRKKAS